MEEVKTYAEKLKDPRWQKKRLQILTRDKWRCRLCGDHKTTLHIHHKRYIDGKDPWDYIKSDLVTVCEHCHLELSTEEYKNIPFDQVKIFKCGKWRGGGRIMFTTAQNGICTMAILGSNNSFLCGFHLQGDTIPGIIEILKASQKR